MKRISAGSVLFLAASISLSIALAEPLKIDYPKPSMEDNGPVAINLLNMGLPRAVGPWNFDVPAGCTNLALGRPVSSSERDPLIGSLDMITDGRKDRGETYLVELGAGTQWVQIDLGRASEIYAVLTWHGIGRGCACKAVTVQLSNDAAFSNGVTTVFNNDIENLNSQGIGKDSCYIETRYGMLFDARGAMARYVRLWSNGNTVNKMNHYIEVEVWGK